MASISIIIPLFNEEHVFPELVRRVQGALAQLPPDGEVILVDDGSSDPTPRLIEAVCTQDPRFHGVLLSRNFGHQIAVSAGLHYADGESVAVIDGDLQDPPEVLPEFYAKLLEGFDVVYGIRTKRKEGIFKKTAYWLFYRLQRRLAAIEIPLDAGDFCLMSRRVARHIRAMPERHRFIRGLRSWVGFRQTGIAYERPERTSGTSKYSFSKLAALAADGIFTFSEKPLRLLTAFGVVVALLAFLWALYIVGWRILTEQPIPGFATLACALFFLGGVQLFGLGLLGEYVGRIHNEVKGRPMFIVDRIVGLRVEQVERRAASTLAVAANQRKVAAVIAEPEPQTSRPVGKYST